MTPPFSPSRSNHAASFDSPSRQHRSRSFRALSPSTERPHQLPTTMLSQALLLTPLAFALKASAQNYSASFTQYGSGDQNGSGNCNVDTTACGYCTSNLSLTHVSSRPTQTDGFTLMENLTGAFSATLRYHLRLLSSRLSKRLWRGARRWRWAGLWGVLGVDDVSRVPLSMPVKNYSAEISKR